jgi:hypothetical protein
MYKTAQFFFAISLRYRIANYRLQRRERPLNLAACTMLVQLEADLP